jgi:hypothetical protein
MDVIVVGLPEFRAAMEKMSDENKKRLAVEDLDIGIFYLVYNDKGNVIGGFNIVPHVGMMCDVFSLHTGMGSLIVNAGVKRGGTTVVIKSGDKFLTEFYDKCGFSFVKSNDRGYDILKFKISYGEDDE